MHTAWEHENAIFILTIGVVYTKWNLFLYILFSILNLVNFKYSQWHNVYAINSNATICAKKSVITDKLPLSIKTNKYLYTHNIKIFSLKININNYFYLVQVYDVWTSALVLVLVKSHAQNPEYYKKRTNKAILYGA